MGIERFIIPFIKDWVIDEVFGRDNRDWIIQTFLDYIGTGNYRFKAEFNNQKAIENTQMENWVREGLYKLQENVIF